MRRRLARIGVCMGITLALCIVVPVVAGEQEGSGKPAVKEDRIEGTVHLVDKDQKIITVQLRGKGLQRQVLYSDTTNFTFRNKPAKFEDVKEGRRVICLGKINDKAQLIATRIDVRDEK